MMHTTPKEIWSGGVLTSRPETARDAGLGFRV